MEGQHRGRGVRMQGGRVRGGCSEGATKCMTKTKCLWFYPPPSRQCFVVGLSREKEMPEHDAAIQLNLARSRQEVQYWNNTQHPVTFQNKTFRVDTSTHREASCLSYCALADSNRNGWGLPEGGAKPDRRRNSADRIQLKLGWLISQSHG